MATIPTRPNYAEPEEDATCPAPASPARQIAATSTPGLNERPAIERALQRYAELIGRTLGLASWYSAQARDRVRGFAYNGTLWAAREADHLGLEAQKRATFVRQKYPLETVGVLAATGFIAGIALRIWRSKAS